MMELVITEIGMLLAFIVGYIFGKGAKSKPILGKLRMSKKEKQARAQYEKESDDLQTTLDNINNYNGTGVGQKKYNYN